MNEALVQHAQHDVDRRPRRRGSATARRRATCRTRRRRRNSCRSPRSACRSRASPCAISATASLSDIARRELKLMVTAGNCSWCAIASGAEVCSKRAKADSGTWCAGDGALGVERVGVVVRRVLATVRPSPVRCRRRSHRASTASRVLLVARLRLEDDAVLVGLAVDGRNLPLPERVVERVVDASASTRRAGRPSRGRHRPCTRRPPSCASEATSRSSGVAAQRAGELVGPFAAPRRRRCRPACTGTARGWRAC